MQESDRLALLAEIIYLREENEFQKLINMCLVSTIEKTKEKE